MNSSAIILQARMNSSRRPYKISALFNGKPLLYWQIKRLQKNIKKQDVIVATTKNSLDDVTEFIALEAGAKIYRGEENDVMQRYIDVAEKYELDYVIRVCGDDPLVDPNCIDILYETMVGDKSDIITASHNNGWLLGTSAEIFSTKALKKAYKNSSLVEKEHVVLHFYNNQKEYRLNKLLPVDLYQEVSLTVDYQEDVENVISILNYFGNINFSQSELIYCLKNNKIKLPHMRIDKYNI